jgi:hypothetical protein
VAWNLAGDAPNAGSGAQSSWRCASGFERLVFFLLFRRRPLTLPDLDFQFLSPTGFFNDRPRARSSASPAADTDGQSRFSR